MGDAQRRASNRVHDAKRRQTQPWRKLYAHPRWVKGRLAHLAEHPLCLMCEACGRVCAATVVDHIQRHNGDQVLFFDRSNWQSLCAPCHDQLKQREEARGYTDRLDADGWPADKRHPANARVAPAQAQACACIEPPPGVKSLEPSRAGPAALNRAQRRVMAERGQPDGN